MKIDFHIYYHTSPGENLVLVIDTPIASAQNTPLQIELSHLSSELLHTVADIPQALEEISYSYEVRRTDGSVRQEWGANRRLRFASTLTHASVWDHWQDEPSDKPFHSSAFTECIFRRGSYERFHSLKPGQLMLSVDAATVEPDTLLAICGECEALGNWNPDKAVVLNDALYPKFTAYLPLHEIPAGTQYKFVLLDAATHNLIAWENCDNRTLDFAPCQSTGAVAVTGLFFRNPTHLWRGAGVAIPVFSLRSDDDWGVGDFIDIESLARWAASTGQRFIQLLPINDTTMTHTWSDSYPYNAISCFALHPMYLRVDEIGTLSDASRMAEYRMEAARLNTLDTVDYEAANNLKERYTRELFAEQGGATLRSAEFKEFVKANSEWLRPYAAFCLLRDRYRTACTRDWEQYAVYTPSIIAQFIKTNQDDINYIFFIQYHLDRQLRRARDYAHSLGVAIKGDIPIGISRDSVDAWLYPRLFNLDSSAGAPPDAFSTLGQNWGFPTYNWEEMAVDGFAWWKDRFRKMSEYFDAYRIDHVLGFFRIWQIPQDALHGLLGVFNAALPLSPEEMNSSFGFNFQSELMTTPYIREYMLADFFGDLAEEARHTFFDLHGDGVLSLKQQFATQRRVADYFASGPDDQRSRRLAQGLLGLIDQVLFIEDPYHKGKFHPRIAAQFTYTYKALPDHQKWCFDRLYNDFFYHRNNDFWYHKAMWKLPPLIDATGMLVCAEDLGMIPACVPAVMDQLKILSLEIQRMPKDPATTFGDVYRYPYLSVCTTSTHDMGGIRQWWEEDPDLTQRYYSEVLHHQGGAPYFAEPWICRQIVDNHLKSPSMLCILPLQDWLSIDGSLRRNDPREEQINVPANPRHYWRYRMHLTLGQLIGATEFNASVGALIASSGR